MLRLRLAYSPGYRCAAQAMSTGRRITLRGFVLDKDGRRVIRDPRRLDVSARLRQRPGGSKKVRVARKGKP
jgi:hypothetical protein